MNITNIIIRKQALLNSNKNLNLRDYILEVINNSTDEEILLNEYSVINSQETFNLKSYISYLTNYCLTGQTNNETVVKLYKRFVLNQYTDFNLTDFILNIIEEETGVICTILNKNCRCDRVEIFTGSLDLLGVITVTARIGAGTGISYITTSMEGTPADWEVYSSINSIDNPAVPLLAFGGGLANVPTNDAVNSNYIKVCLRQLANPSNIICDEKRVPNPTVQLITDDVQYLSYDILNTAPHILSAEFLYTEYNPTIILSDSNNVNPNIQFSIKGFYNTVTTTSGVIPPYITVTASSIDNLAISIDRLLANSAGYNTLTIAGGTTYNVYNDGNKILALYGWSVSPTVI